MTNLEIEAFLAIYRTRRISVAAEELYISQSSLSARLQTLERELGYTLFLRNKGARVVELTDAGEQFFPLAEQYMSIVKQMKGLKGSHYEQRLRVAAVNSIGTYLLMPVYDAFMKEHPEIYLRMAEYNNDRSKPIIEKGQVDLLFSTQRFESDNIMSFPILLEPLSLITTADAPYPDSVGIEDLPEQMEVYINWDNAFDAWHRAVFKNTRPKLDLENMEQLRYFLHQPGRWAFVSDSVSRAFLLDPGLRELSPTYEIPRRIIYCSCSRKKRNAPAIEAFLNCLQRELHDVTLSLNEPGRPVLSAGPEPAYAQ